MVDELARLSELAEQFSSGATATLKCHGALLTKAVGTLEAGQTDEGLAFELEVVEAYLSASGQREDIEMLDGLARLLRA